MKALAVGAAFRHQRTRSDPSDIPKANNALTFKLDHLVGAEQLRLTLHRYYLELVAGDL